jgi:hypothetical protein
MKRFLPTLILVVLCIGGFWYSSAHSFFKDKSKDAPKQLIAVPSADVVALSYKNPDGTDVELANKGGAWEMNKPSSIPINRSTIDSWIGIFTALNYEAKIDDNPQDLSAFGLTQPKQEFQVILKDGTVKKLIVGKPFPVAGNSYAKLDDSPVVYGISDKTVQSLSKPQMEFLEKSAVKISYDKVKSFQMEWKGQKWLLEKAEADKTVYDTSWKIGSKELKSNEGQAILDKVINIDTDQMVKPVAELNMTSPELRIEVKEEDNGKELTNVFVGKIDNDTIWIVKQGSPWAYTIPAANLQDLFDKGK